VGSAFEHVSIGAHWKVRPPRIFQRIKEQFLVPRGVFFNHLPCELVVQLSAQLDRQAHFLRLHPHIIINIITIRELPLLQLLVMLLLQ
jgi:hypothetical protein